MRQLTLEISKLVILITCLYPMAIFTQSIPQFQESEGVIIIEIESAIDYGSWELDTNKTGYTGSGYLVYKGPNLFNNPGMSLMPFEIAVEKAGKYRFQWHSLIAVGESNTEHNDSWLRFKDAGDFYGQKGDEKVYPKGVGKSPNPEGSSARGWLKIYQNSRDGWTWQTRTSDRDPHDIFVEFDSAGIYTLEVSGRSNGHAIDRLALYHSDVSVSAALDLTRPESDQIQTTAVTKSIIPARLELRPTLATDFITMDISAVPHSDRSKATVFDFTGQHVLSFPLHSSAHAKTLVLPVSQLPRGQYLIQIQTNQTPHIGRFIKQ